MSDYSVHDEPDFARVYDEDAEVAVRRGDLRALLDLATGSMDFGSGFWDNEQVEVARKIAVVLDIDPDVVTPSRFVCQYRGRHEWTFINRRHLVETSRPMWRCEQCYITTLTDPTTGENP